MKAVLRSAAGALAALPHGAMPKQAQLRSHQHLEAWAMPLAKAVPPSLGVLASESTPPLGRGSKQATYSCSDTAVGRLCAHDLTYLRLEPSAESPQRVPYRRQGPDLAFNSKGTCVSAFPSPGALDATPVPRGGPGKLDHLLRWLRPESERMRSHGKTKEFLSSV